MGELPADVLLLRGTAVVNEASLTGESVPQIKTSLTSEPIDFEDELDMTGVRVWLAVGVPLDVVCFVLLLLRPCKKRLHFEPNLAHPELG